MSLKPTTVMYLQARPDLAPKKFEYTGPAMIVSPHPGANYLSFSDAIRNLQRLDNEVNMDIEPTGFDAETFIKRTLAVHEFVEDESLVVLHEQTLKELFDNLPPCTN